MDEQQTYRPAPDIDEEEIDLSELLGVLIENRLLIIAVVMAALVVGGLKAFTATPIYQADALLQVEATQSALSALDINGFLTL